MQFGDRGNKPESIFTLAVLGSAACLWIYSLLQYPVIRDSTIVAWCFSTFRDITSVIFILPGLVIVALITTAVSNQLDSRQKLRTTFTIFAGFLILCATVSLTPLPRQPGLWAGFGLIPTLLSLVATCAVILKPRLIEIGRDTRSVTGKLTLLFALGVVLWYLPLYVQPPNGLINLGDTSYHVLDELLAPSLGAYPYANYSPQYTGMLGWALLPLKLLPFSAESTMVGVIVAANMFNLLIPLLATLILSICFPRLPRLLTLAAFVSIWSVSGAERGASVHLREFAHFARFVPVFVSMMLIAWTFKSLPRVQASKLTVTGVAVGLTCLNSADSGLPFGIATLVALTLATFTKAVTRRDFLYLIFVVLATVCLYPILLLTLGESFSMTSYIGLRSLARDAYGGGIPSVTAPHLLVMGLTVASIAHGLRLATNPVIGSLKQCRGILAITTGLWMLSLLAKYLLFGHPVALPPLFPGSFIIAGLLIGEIQITPLSRETLTNRMLALPLVLLAAVPVGALWQAPDPRDELRRISGNYVGTTDWSGVPGRPSDGWTPEALSSAYGDFIGETERVAESFDPNNDTIGYFGMFGHTVELLTGVNNVLGIPAPESLRFGVSQEKLACIPVDQKQPRYVLVFASDFPCTGYFRNYTYSTDQITVFRRRT